MKKVALTVLFVWVANASAAVPPNVQAAGVERPLDLRLPPLVAASVSPPSLSETMRDGGGNGAEEQEPWLNGKKVHRLLGLTTLGLAGVTALANEARTFHEYAAFTTTAFAAATVTSGFISHWDDIDFSQGIWEENNLHFILSTLGSLAMLTAVSLAPRDAHPGFGIAGGALMGAAVVIVW